MDISKRQGKKKIANKNNKKSNRLAKLRKIIKKKTNTKKHKMSHYEKTVRKFNESRQACKPVLNRRVTLGPLRPKQPQEGMFLKGFRTQFISRESLNEANEARKNEDINKIIDIGRVIVKKGLPTQRNDVMETNDWKTSTVKNAHSSLKYETDGKTSETEIFSSAYDFTFNSKVTLEKINLSPISLTVSTVQKDEKDSQVTQKDFQENEQGNKKKFLKNKIDYTKEFHKFSQQYDKVVVSEILSSLPKNGVLENALKSIEYLSRKNKNEIRTEKYKKIQSMNAYEFISKNTDPCVEAEKEFLEENFFLQKTLYVEEDIPHNQKNKISEINFNPNIYPSYGEELMESNPLSLQLKNINLKSNNYELASFLQEFEDENMNPQEDNVESRLEIENDMNFISPPLQFYRRNMF